MKLAVVLVWCVLAAAVIGGSRAQNQEPKRTVDGDHVCPYESTPPEVAAVMLQMACADMNSVVMDLGSGDGRLVRLAASSLGSRAVGVELDGELVAKAEALTRLAVEANDLSPGLVSFRQESFVDTDVTRATVVLLYLIPTALELIEDKLFDELPHGAVVITHDYPFHHHVADEMWFSRGHPEKVSVNGEDHAYLYKYVVRNDVGGQTSATLSSCTSSQPAAAPGTAVFTIDRTYALPHELTYTTRVHVPRGNGLPALHLLVNVIVRNGALASVWLKPTWVPRSGAAVDVSVSLPSVTEESVSDAAPLASSRLLLTSAGETLSLASFGLRTPFAIAVSVTAPTVRRDVASNDVDDALLSLLVSDWERGHVDPVV